MATITGLTAARMLDIEAASIVSGEVVGDDLILTTHGGIDINAGDVRGPQGDEGPAWSGTYLVDESSTEYTPGSLGADIIYPHVELDLTVGTWLVLAQASVRVIEGVDACSIAVVDTDGPVNRIQGPVTTASTTASAEICIAMGFIVVPSTMNIRIQARRNGVATLAVGFPGAMNPTQRLSAVKIV